MARRSNGTVSAAGRLGALAVAGLVALALGGCPPEDDGGGDAGADAADTAAPDAVPSDTAGPDTAAPDAVPSDTAAPDTAAPDAVPADTAAPDTGAPDTGAPDTGTVDTGSADTGTGDSSVGPDVPPPACAGPSPVGCKVAGCPAGKVCDPTAGCAPSACACDASSGAWICTEDCGGGVCVAGPAGCGAGEVETVDGCLTCDAALDAVGALKAAAKAEADACSEDADCVLVWDGTACQGACQTSVAKGEAAGYQAALAQISADYCADWSPTCPYATPDCLEVQAVCGEDGRCRTGEPTLPGCSTPSPAGCKQTGCPAGLVCDTGVGCKPSSCSCDPLTGSWGCTKDCGGGTCVPDTGECAKEQVPTVEGCLSCDETLGAVQAAKEALATQYAACSSDSDCALVPTSTDCQGGCQAAISAEGVDAWSALISDLNADYCAAYSPPCPYASPKCALVTAVCAEDKTCQLGKPGGACGPSPAGCVATGCAEGFVCDTQQGCAPSACGCDAATGQWICTADCNGGICVPDGGGCPKDTVPTVDGCLSCGDALGAVQDAKKAAQQAWGACAQDADCALVWDGTDCQGACQVSVNADYADDYAGLLQHLSQDYCGGYPPVCGYATPSCLPATPKCDAGQCGMDFSFP